LSFFNTNFSKVDFNWSIYSPYVDIGKLSSSLHRNTSSKKKQVYSFFETLNNKIDQLFDECNAYVTIKADKIVYQKFSASNIGGKLTLRNDMIDLNNFSLQHAGGSILVNASSKDRGRNSDLLLTSRMQDVNIRELFAAFNSFGMESLTSKNIDGNFSADINLKSMLDPNNHLYRRANKGYIDFSLKNGKLENFRPLMDIDNRFLQKRDLANIDFAELRDRFEIDGNDIKINRMEIRSTAVDMYVEGIYSFADNTDLSVQIPLHNQKKDSGVVPENKGNNSKGGLSIFLRAKDDKYGKLKISYDVLGRFRNKK
jgi:AsmA-like protein